MERDKVQSRASACSVFVERRRPRVLLALGESECLKCNPYILERMCKKSASSFEVCLKEEGIQRILRKRHRRSSNPSRYRTTCHPSSRNTKCKCLKRKAKSKILCTHSSRRLAELSSRLSNSRITQNSNSTTSSSKTPTTSSRCRKWCTTSKSRKRTAR